MCTVVIVKRPESSLPLVVAANRDEFYARPAAGPRAWEGSPPFVAPVDLEKGGTWLAVNGRGFVVAVTNQQTIALPEPGKRSRGELVVALARIADPARARDFLRAVDGRQYNSFNLLVGDAKDLFVAYGRVARQELEFENVPAGVSVLPNDTLDSRRVPKVARIHELLRDLPLHDAAVVPSLIQVLRDRHIPDIQPPDTPARWRALHAVLVETPSYGTRSSAIITMAERETRGFFWADGPPHETEFVDRIELLQRAAAER